MKHVIFGVHISERTDNVPAVQACLSKYGCSIRTRLGLHDTGDGICSPSGLVLLDVIGEQVEPFYTELQTLNGVDVQRMDFAE